MDPCLGYVNAYIWTPNCHVMNFKPIISKVLGSLQPIYAISVSRSDFLVLGGPFLFLKFAKNEYSSSQYVYIIQAGIFSLPPSE